MSLPALRQGMAALAALATLCCTSLAFAGSADFNCPQFFAGGQPPQFEAGPEQRLRALCFDAFAVMHNGNTHTPLFVAERLSRASIKDAADETRTDHFYSEARLPSAERATLDDYQGSGYDRGHMAPAADMPNPQAMAQSFSLANMVPQVPEHNRKTWADTEKAVRKYVLRANGDVYVITGPVFPQQAQRIGRNGVAVPSHLYKLVYDAGTGRAWAYWQENAKTTRMSAPISYPELVQRTGINFLPALPATASSEAPPPETTPSHTPSFRQQPPASNDEAICLTGPRGGHYQLINGKKKYGCTP
jgi:endonuclease G